MFDYNHITKEQKEAMIQQLDEGIAILNKGIQELEQWLDETEHLVSQPDKSPTA